MLSLGMGVGAVALLTYQVLQKMEVACPSLFISDGLDLGPPQLSPHIALPCGPVPPPHPCTLRIQDFYRNVFLERKCLGREWD